MALELFKYPDDNSVKEKITEELPLVMTWFLSNLTKLKISS
jgi:hypothetical protein